MSTSSIMPRLRWETERLKGRIWFTWRFRIKGRIVRAIFRTGDTEYKCGCELAGTFVRQIHVTGVGSFVPVLWCEACGCTVLEEFLPELLSGKRDQSACPAHHPRLNPVNFR